MSQRRQRESSRRGSGNKSIRKDFHYRGRTKEQIENRKPSRIVDPFVKSEFIKYSFDLDDSNRIRICPPTWDGCKHYGFEIAIHYGVGVHKSAYLCLNRMKGEPCPICEEQNKARANGEDKDYIKSLYPSEGWLLWVVDRMDRKTNTPKWFRISQSVDDEIVMQAKDKETGKYLEIDHHEEGYDLFFEGYELGGFRRMRGVSLARNSSILEDQFLDFIDEHPIPSILLWYDYDHIEKALHGKKVESSEDRADDSDKEDQSTKTDDLTYDEVMEMRVEDLEDICIDELNFNENEVQEMSEKELQDVIINEFNIKVPEESPQDKLRNLRNNRTRR